MFVPDPMTLHAAATGFEEALADVLWVRTVLLFADWVAGDESTFSREYLHRFVLAIATLDPGWRTVYYYGGVELRVMGDIDAADDVFRRGHDALPDEPFFPFSVGMDAYLYRDDPATAAKWMAKAAAIPRSPRWYAGAAAAMQRRTGDAAGAIQYLREVYASTTDPGVRANTRYQIARLEHNELVATWEEACLDYRARTGHSLARPEDLKKLGFDPPPSPYGDAWVVDSDGVVRAQTAREDRLRKARVDELRLAR